MLKEIIKYEDFNGEEQVETAYFHLSKVEILEMEADKKGGLEKHIKKVVESEDNAEIVAIFKDIILRSYGKKSEDGKRFIKNDEMREEFAQSNAFVELYVSVATDADKAAKFVKGILPKK